MDGRGRPVKREEQGNPVRDDQGNLVYEEDDRLRSATAPQNDEGVREAHGARRPSTTMGTDSALPFEQMTRLDARQEQEDIKRRRNSRRGSRPNLEEIIESSSGGPANEQSFLFAIQQQRQQQQQQQMTAGGLKTFPSFTPSAALESFDLYQAPPFVGDDTPPAEPERPIAARGRRPSIGQLF